MAWAARPCLPYSDPSRQTFDTGDLGRLDADGLLDATLKIRGRRVDPAEVEAVLLNIDGLHQAAVVGREQAGQLVLVAYVVCPQTSFPGEAALRQALHQSFPEHLIPSRFVRLDDFPRTAGGKINRAALPDPASIAPAADRQSPEIAPAARSGRGEKVVSTPEEDSLENQIALVWEEVLGRGPIGRHDDFFASLGANSLQTVAVITALERALGREIPIAALLEHRTVESSARYLRRQLATGRQSPVTMVQRGQAERRPLFFLHGDIYGAGIYCHRLARQLGAEQPFYSLAPLGFENGPPPRTIEAMAARFISEVRAIQPHGPYLLGGYCNSGLIAYEMARQLAASGESIGLLALVRTGMLPNQWPGVRRLIETAGAFLGTAEERRLDLFAAIHVRLRRWRQAARRGLWSRATYALDFAQELPVNWRRLTAQPAACGMAATDSPPQAPVLKRFRVVWTAHRRAALRYVPGAYSGPVHLFWPRHDEVLLRGDHTAGWKRFAAQVIPHSLPGDHVTCVTQHAGVLGDQLRRYVDLRFPPV